ncbi:deoxyribodipyrimidine photo-lyase [Moritella sp. Urea-trap-13]|uniref:deoxyribodipyrimidine photo-lyase n=1 Tax=Moritella sp. Urea-trap-13 TaxID=2058327 RepID=UPI000C32E90D|nr:deoxyribodipyrimidine photo-lyase [Moritella sp. Urea-trap-13]PKH07689.1 deoxyribodipyrimidine photo-lyase [Moritella sp. Urea-trap-13]
MENNAESVMWFRGDLRVLDNPALAKALRQGCTKALFMAPLEQWLQHDMAPIQLDFIERHLNLLRDQLAELGVELTCLTVTDFDEQVSCLSSYCQTQHIKHIYANSEVELNEHRRDEKIITNGLPLHLSEADVIVPKGSVLNGQQEMYKVFTPFRNAWLKQLRQHPLNLAFLPEPTAVIAVHQPAEDIVLAGNKTSSQKWPLATVILQQVIPEFIANKCQDYQQLRDYPSVKGTSGLSPYLAIGAISPRTVVNALTQAFPTLLDDTASSAFCWLNELAWRDFYKHLLFHYPALCKHQNYQKKYNHLHWHNDNALFEAWCQGQTGYPLVDAAMRQLLQTGWMHNRLRMVVASFLTKHLLIDWRRGERFFMQHLIDGDFSANNGGWQWAAGTGCDAQPYFRIFNPITQSKKFDAEGAFIRKFVPELATLPSKYIHFPHQYLQDTGQTAIYFPPIVDHKTAREQALGFYKQHLSLDA